MTTTLLDDDLDLDEEEEFEPTTYDKLPPEVQEKAVERWRETYSCPQWDDVDYLTELLVDDLDYEFGIRVAYRNTKYNNDKTASEPDMEWDTYPFRVSFHDDLDLDAMLAHGVKGCEYFHQEIMDLRVALAMIDLLDSSVYGESEVIMRLSPQRDYYTRVEINIHERADDHASAYYALSETIEKLLEAIYEKACRRLKDILESEIDYRNSDEYIVEYLSESDHEFDEDGKIV